MRNIIFISFSLCYSTATFCQNINSVSLSDEFKSLQGMGNNKAGFTGIQTYTTHTVTGSPFFNDSWSNGSIRSVNDRLISAGFLFLYDKLKQELFIKSKDSSVIMQIYKDKIKSFSIESDKPHFFVPAARFDSTLKGNFLEAITPEGNYQLLKLTTTTFEKANMNDIEKIKEADFSDKFVDHFSYYIFHNNQLKGIKTLNERNIRKALKDEAKKLDDFFDRHANDELNEEMLILLINSLNSQ